MQYDRFNLHPKLFSKVCRTCLCEGEMNNIFEVDHAAVVLSGFLSINVSNGDTFPQNICNSCLEELSRIHNFAKRCKQVEDTLQLILDESTNAVVLKEGDRNFIDLGCLREGDQLIVTETRVEEQSNEHIGKADLNSKNNIATHRVKANHPKKLNRTCDICKKTFKGAHLLKVHMHSHTKETPYECNICCARFSSPNSVTRHKKLHSGERPHICDICQKAFARPHVLNEHKKIHSDEKPYVCSYCTKTFRAHNTYKIHMTRHKIKNGELPPKILESHTCEICQQILSTKSVLRTHMLTHGEKLFLCTHCGMSFYNQGALTIHFRIHTGEKPFKCKYCEKPFRQRGSLLAHEMIHTGQKPHTCKFCKKCFTHQYQLKVHLRTHSGERPYICRFCQKSFVNPGNLKVHVRTHTGETPYHCPVCNKGFYDSSSMKKHRKGHGDITVDLKDIVIMPDV